MTDPLHPTPQAVGNSKLKLKPLTDNHLPPLIQALQNPKLFDHPVGHFRVIQTHISWVLLTGRFAYKIKKPLDLGFLNFSTLEKRRFYCQEELRLNSRLAPDLYLKVVNITGSPENPSVNGEGSPIEFAVKMKEFPQEAQLDKVLKKGELQNTHLDSLAETLAAFHQTVRIAEKEDEYGSPETIARPIRDNFITIKKSLTDTTERTQLARLEKWAEQKHRSLTPLFIERKKKGFIRECHGDMHLANMALVDGRIVIFDCIEFNPQLRWIDVMSELAFLVMDLEDRGCPGFAQRVLNRYLEITGDYTGLQTLSYFKIYRALVRAKVARIRMSQMEPGTKERQMVEREFETYLHLAEGYAKARPPWLAITYGFSGSGKTTIAQSILERSYAVRVRTDVERKRMGGQEGKGGPSRLGEGLYGPDMTDRTYQHLRDLAKMILDAGIPVIVDGTFLKRSYRKRFLDLAEQLKVPAGILEIKTPETLLRKRIESRMKAGRDASDATIEVFESQKKLCEPLTQEEKRLTITIENAAAPDIPHIIRKIQTFTKNK